jgi:hypothetical protein
MSESFEMMKEVTEKKSLTFNKLILTDEEIIDNLKNGKTTEQENKAISNELEKYKWYRITNVITKFISISVFIITLLILIITDFEGAGWWTLIITNTVVYYGMKYLKKAIVYISIGR